MKTLYVATWEDGWGNIDTELFTSRAAAEAWRRDVAREMILAAENRHVELKQKYPNQPHLWEVDELNWKKHIKPYIKGKTPGTIAYFDALADAFFGGWEMDSFVIQRAVINGVLPYTTEKNLNATKGPS